MGKAKRLLSPHHDKTSNRTLQNAKKNLTISIKNMLMAIRILSAKFCPDRLAMQKILNLAK